MDNDENKISDYSVAGLDQYMRPLNSPRNNQGSYVGGMDFNTYFDRNAVTAINLRNFSFNAGTGGTLTLGGTANGNGNFQLKDAGGTTIVTGDNTGLTVNNGSITIKNSGGTTTIDSKGAVSTALTSFTASTAASLNQNFTNGTQTDITGSELTLTLDRTANVLFLVTCTIYAFPTSGANNANLSVDLYINSTQSARITYGATSSPYDINVKTLHCHRIATLSSGSNTITLKGLMESITGSPTMVVYSFRLSYLVLGT